MNYSRNRRRFLLAAVSVPMAAVWTSWATQGNATVAAQAKLAKLERTLSGRLGVFALNTANGNQLSYRADEYFPMCSTFKVILVQVTIKKVRKLSCDRKVYLGRKIGIWNFALCDSFQG